MIMLWYECSGQVPLGKAGTDMQTRLALLASALLVMALVTALVPVPARGQQIAYIAIWFLGFNTTLPPFDNVRARQAVASAIDRAQITLVDSNNMAIGVEPPGCLAHNASARMHPYDVDRAKELLAQSGVKLDEDGDVSLWHLSRLRGRESPRKELEILQGNISAIGFRPILREFGNYDALERIATLPVVKMSYWGVGWNTLDCSRGTFLEDLVHSKGSLNYFGYRNADVDNLISQAVRTGDRQTKIRLFQEAQQKILDEAVIVPVYWYTLSLR